MPAVSVVVPTYQRRGLVLRAAESVLAQTLGDLELIVVDDGSTDGTEEALAEIEDERLRYVWQENAGVVAARNHALTLVRGEIVAFLDSDNRWLPDHLEVLVEVLRRHPEAVFATTCESFEIEGDAGPESSELIDAWPRVFIYGRRAGFISGVAMRREPLEEVGGFDERFGAGEDTDLFVRLGVLGPMAAVRRRTLVRGVTSSSLKERARRSGEYLRSAELSASNVKAAAEQRPDEPELMREALAALSLAKAFSAVDRGELETARTELAEAVKLAPGLSWSGILVANRVFKHLPQSTDWEGLLAAYSTVAEIWPDPRADAARFCRALALLAALRLGRPQQAARLVRDWPRGGNVAFLRRRTHSFRRAVDLFMEERRDRAEARAT